MIQHAHPLRASPRRELFPNRFRLGVCRSNLRRISLSPPRPANSPKCNQFHAQINGRRDVLGALEYAPIWNRWGAWDDGLFACIRAKFSTSMSLCSFSGYFTTVLWTCFPSALSNKRSFKCNLIKGKRKMLAEASTRILAMQVTETFSTNR